MPQDISDKFNSPRVRVFSSSVVEIVAAVQVLADPKHHEFLADWVEIVHKHLSYESLEILKILYHIEFQGLGLYEFVLMHRNFDDIDGFCGLLKDYDDIDFIYMFFSQEISRDKIKALRENKEKFPEFVQELEWFIRGSSESVQYVIYKTHTFKKGISKLIEEIKKSGFIDKLEQFQETYSRSIDKVNSGLRDKEPLELCQDIMGKKFMRVSDYKGFLFIPSYFISPHYIRIFNDTTLMLIFDMTKNAISRVERAEEVSRVLGIISDKTRIEILRLLINGTTYGKDLAGRLDLTTATISHHLDLLKSVNLLKEERIKNIKYFKANVEEVQRVLDEFKNYLFNK